VARQPHSDNERPGWAGYFAAIVVSALGHAGLLAFALLVLPNWLHSATVEPPSMTVKIVDNIPAGDLGTHLPKLSGHNKPEPEQVAKAEVKPEEPPKPEEKPLPPSEPPKPEDDKNAVSLNSTAPSPTPTPEPPPAVIPATPKPAPTETPKKVAEPEPTPKPPEAKPHRHEKVIVHNPPKAKNTPIQMAKAEKTPDVHEQFRKLQQEMLKKRIEETRKLEADNDSSDDDDSEMESTASENDSGERGPVASNANSAGKGYGIGSGTGSMGKLEDLQYLLYFRTVQHKVKDAWTFPGGSNELSADVEFSIGADGALNSVKIAKSSGDSAFDESVLRAIRRAAPFPPPPDRYRAQFSDVVSTFKLGELKS
jgi:TonB family protein